MKKCLFVLSSLITISMTTSVFAANLIINEKPISLKNPPVVVDGRTLVPVRTIFEELGATVTWDPVEKFITGVSDKKVIVMQIDNIYAGMQYIDTPDEEITKVKLDAPATIINGNTYVPLRFVAESLDCEVVWDKNTQTINITTGINSAITELKNKYESIPEVSYLNVKSTPKGDLSFAVMYNSATKISDFPQLLSEGVEDVLSVAAKYNTSIFQIEVGIQNSNGDSDIYWHSYNLESNTELSKTGDFFYLSKNTEQEDVYYTDVAKFLNAASTLPDKKESLGLTLEGYNAIKTGMTLQKVREIIGHNGSEQASSDSSAVYLWSQTGNNGSYKAISITFIDNKVFSKAQTGL